MRLVIWMDHRRITLFALRECGGCAARILPHDLLQAMELPVADQLEPAPSQARPVDQAVDQAAGAAVPRTTSMEVITIRTPQALAPLAVIPPIRPAIPTWIYRLLN